jgi:hypothetical protein
VEAAVAPAALELAAAYESLGRWFEAESLRRDVLARRRKSTQPDSPPLAGDLARLGMNLLSQGVVARRVSAEQ